MPKHHCSITDATAFCDNNIRWVLFFFFFTGFHSRIILALPLYIFSLSLSPAPATLPSLHPCQVLSATHTPVTPSLSPPSHPPPYLTLSSPHSSLTLPSNRIPVPLCMLYTMLHVTPSFDITCHPTQILHVHVYNSLHSRFARSFMSPFRLL